ncbi:tyrosine-type recombinase/integrase [Rhodobacter capsulatus]|uniref:tyrosine-type recombinase/integrase n=1 Tax=Rhodobacter capsulatus TaxID=1061 RepID=UPI0003D315A9|nr:tyrosine-type recombinase/integrase [Rhodobacter capsulatus]ETD84369.1 integrase [Rhodobacter capsulatus B6]
MSLQLRGRTYYLVRRTPSRYTRIETRGVVWLSLGTDSKREATVRATVVWDVMQDVWEARLRGDAVAEQTCLALIETATKQHRPTVSLLIATGALRGETSPASAGGALQAFPSTNAEGVAALESPGAGEPSSPPARAAIAERARDTVRVARSSRGPSALTVEAAMDAYWTLAADRIAGMSADQARRWKAPRVKAVRNFVAIAGNKRLDQITADDMLSFRAWWVERIVEHDMAAGSGNKDIGHLSDILKTVNRMMRLGLDLPLGDLHIKKRERPRRPPFSDFWIKSKILATGALDGMNVEARVILVAMVNTGARPSEIANLTRSRIRLDVDIPHISIEPEGRVLKTSTSRRVIPLAGVSLAALKECPDGFPRYRDNPGLSDTQNKFLRDNGLLESENHTVYSLRHSFESRMIREGVDERIRRDLFGHALGRQRYGEVSLETLRDAVEKVAL